MILSAAQDYLPRHNFNIEPHEPVVIALGDHDDALCYTARLMADTDGGYAVQLMSSSLLLDRVRLYGAQHVLVRLEKDVWAQGLLGPVQKTHDDGCAVVSVQIFALAPQVRDLAQGINPRT